MLPVIARHFRRHAQGSALVAGLFLVGCGEGDAQPAPGRARSPECVAPAGVSNHPTSIEQTRLLINALPKPLTLACFVESLARPLRLFASRSQLSAQPATGLRSPRLFVFMGANTMTVVPEGDGAHLLEFGEQRDDFRSLKAEIPFPVTTELAPDAPFHIMFNERLTNCAFCHAAEEQDPSIGYARAFVSEALRPRDGERVAPESMRAELASCDASREPGRCALLDALFGWGPVEEQPFPAGMATFD